LLDDRSGIWSAVALVMAAHSAKPEEKTMMWIMEMDGFGDEMEWKSDVCVLIDASLLP
jgi:hypothetical protein